ncbi:membrane MotB of proton-channel complex MotA/MotB family protein [Paraburkholderia xenovorans LB400]|uniref:Flagellar motor protein (MotB) n=1 Tax=Paraburkholderia xenovorans (strain LB400) TaxID=266265 RepID=Q13FB6_PARXL|nr:OmpA family protein [Paraburkholderia xenovorans]ABE37223.1 putative flagellar motor protein (MotB) [Paraburkholderia xenovorans LB400]AIP34344.1 membrane MotB of proton-channel complex MotA/MotB family protein [Paraburkholderia xenovorans LB400]
MSTSSGSKRLTAEKAARDESHDSGAHPDRWLISYADLITTLMVLFLALYVLELAKNSELQITTLQHHPAKQAVDLQPFAASAAARNEAGKQLLSLLAPLRDNHRITISQTPQAVEIAINARILFNSGDARLLPESFAVLQQIAAVLRDRAKNNILVEGHTDSLPISTAKYESNWELSSARAGAVVRFFADRGIEGHRMAAIGRADNFPLIIGNDAVANAANRRVTILVEY